MTRIDVLTMLAEKKIEIEEAGRLLSTMDRPASKLSCKVSEKCALSVYGLQRMPVTLYVEQWERLLADEQVKAIKDFAKANSKSLSRKSS